MSRPRSPCHEYPRPQTPEPEAEPEGDDADQSKSNGEAVPPAEGQSGLDIPRSPSPRYRRLSYTGDIPATLGVSPSPYGRRPSLSGESTPTSTRCPTPVTRASSPTSGVLDDDELKEARKTKSVSFHSQTNWKNEKKFQSAYDCLEYMMEGSRLVKMRSSSRQFHRYYTLAEDLSAVRWTPTSKKSSKACLPIEQIKEIRTGRNCEALRHKDMQITYNEERIFSILYGDAYESLDLMATSPEEAGIWVIGLNALIGATKSPDTKDEKQAVRETWLKEMFEKTTSRDSQGFIDPATCISLIKKLDSQVETIRVRQKLQEFSLKQPDDSRGRINSQDFIDMFKEISTRPEIYFLLIRIANKDYLTLEDLHLFLEGEQGMAGVNEERVKDLIEKYEPAPEARKSKHMLIDGFTKYLISEECDLFDPCQRVVCQDMNQPLGHYFISTSHNTYLLEDQLKGPSSIDGYIRVLTCGCRCVKVDVWDGQEEPVVFHGNTLTTKIPFRDVIDAIGSYSFDFSVYPVLLHLENHCKISQQKRVAEILKKYLGSHLYIHPPDSKKSITELSPEDLKYKIILMGKKLKSADMAEGDVSDEDEGGETKRNNNAKKIQLCRELSSLISLRRSRFTNLQTARETQSRSEMCSLSEAASSKLTLNCAEDLVNHNKRFLTRVYPNSSRVDSSNYNPQDFWNSGCQMVALNFQTPGQMMDVYEGRFRGNGGSGYLLKPAVMREHISIFSAQSRDTIPGVAPQELKIKIISGQCLPKPRGSTAIKANTIDPYVVIQIFGIPADCTEAKTRTVRNDSSYPIYDESFDFQILLPELALVRFVVLDDEFIGDDFVGQCTIPFDCIQTGYRHIRLLSSMGEPLDNASLFVHVSISNKDGGGKPQKTKKKKTQSTEPDFKPVGLRSADDIFKEATSAVIESEYVQEKVRCAWTDLQDECGLQHTANMKQCLKVTVSRFLAHPDTCKLVIKEENGIPFLKSSNPGPLPSHLHKLEAALEKVILEIHHFLSTVESLKESLEKQVKPALDMHDNLESKLHSAGIKGRRANKAMENYAYNVRTIRGQFDRLIALNKKCKIAMEQLNSTKVTLGNQKSRERSPSVRERPCLTMINSTRNAGSDNNPCYGSLPRSPTSPNNSSESKPKSILKKSNSNLESSSGVGYVSEDYDMLSCGRNSPGIFESRDPLEFLKPPLQHSLSYTPGFSCDANTSL